MPFIAIIILFCTACDKFEISSKQAETFVRYYGIGMDDEGMQVIATDQGYLIMANVKNPGSGRDICIIKTDKYGNTIAPITTIGGASDEIGYIIKPMGDGYIIAGSKKESQNAVKNVYYILLNSEGDFEGNDKTIPLANINEAYAVFNNEAYDVFVEDDGELVFTGYTEYSATFEPTQQRDILFLKYNISANTAEFNRMGDKDEDEEAYSIALAYDTTYIFAGYKTNSGRKKISLVRWDGKNNILVGEDISTVGNSEAKCIINTKNKDIYGDDIFIISCNNEVITDQSQILLVETDYTLRKDSTVVLGSFGEKSINTVQSMSFSNNSLYLCGTSSSGESDYGDMLLIRLTQDGRNPQYLYMGDGTTYRGRGFDLTNENGYVITGASYLNEKSMITLYKVNSEGSL